MVKYFLIVLSVFTLTFSAFAEDKSSIKVGIILPLTGPLAEYGVALQNGIKLAQNEEKGILGGLQFVYEDSQYNPQSAISIFRKFTSDADVKFIINFGCPTSQAIAPLVEQTKIPTALFCSSLLLTKDRKYSFGMCSPANEWASILSEHLNSKEFKNICLVLTQNDYLMNEYKALQAEIKKRGNQQTITVIDQYTPQDTDFRTSVLKIPSKSCDALGVYLLPNQVRTFFDQSRHLQLKSQIFGTDIFESADEIAASKGAMEGSVFVNLAVPPKFKEKYISEYHNENQATMACVVHDIIIRVGKILTDKDTTKSSATLMERIKKSGEQTGDCGTSSFVESETGEQFVRFPVVLKHVVDGKIEDYKK